MPEKSTLGLGLGLGAVAVGVLAYIAMQQKLRLRVAELYCYPVKSCAPVKLEEARLDMYGFEHDRKWVVVNAETGEMMHQRICKKMATIKTAFVGDELHIRAPGVSEVLKVKLNDKADEEKPRRTVIIFGQELAGIDEGDAAAKWFSAFLGKPCALCKRPSSNYRRCLTATSVDVLSGALTEVPGMVAYTDEHPLLVCTTASLRDLNDKLVKAGKKAVPMSRFRANIILDEEPSLFSAGKRHKGFIEHAWKEISLGSVSLLSTGQKNRCVMTTVDQATGTSEPRHLSPPAEGEPVPMAATNKNYYEPVTMLRGYRLDEDSNSPVFGESFSHTRDSVGKAIKVGDFLTAHRFKEPCAVKASS